MTMARRWLSVAGRLGVACGGAAAIALLEGHPELVVGLGLLWLGMAIGVLMTLVCMEG